MYWRRYFEMSNNTARHVKNAKYTEVVEQNPHDTLTCDWRTIQTDNLGLLPRTGRGNRFILVISDYARYPEAIPLRDTTAPKIAEVLIELFARFEIPEEILTDQGTNFTSKLLGELYRLSGVKAIQTSPYHPQTDGLVERFNRTHKAMLRKVLRWRKEKLGPNAPTRTFCLP